MHCQVTYCRDCRVGFSQGGMVIMSHECLGNVALGGRHGEMFTSDGRRRFT